jgi:hypothetical protein
MFHQGSTDLCNSPSLTNLVRNTTGLVGVRGTYGFRGLGESNVHGSFGNQAGDGFEVDCLWSAPCTGGTCANGNACLSGYCQP